MTYSEILEIPPYGLDSQDKQKLMYERLGELFTHHYENCDAYRCIVDFLGVKLEDIRCCEDFPFLPVRLFKELELKSVPEDEIFKTMTSSGTTGQAVSKIFLDRETAGNQQKTLVKIMTSFMGKERLPMLIIDSPSVLKNRKMFSARGAGILGFSILASERVYALDEDMRLDFDKIQAFLKKHEGKPILLFGFTFMVWQYFYKALLEKEEKLDLSNGILIHGGGWKKLLGEKVAPEEFRQRLQKVCKLKRIHDYYGMVEQTGCIYMECECGHLHSSIFSDIIVRKAKDFSVCSYGEKGILQVISMIPKSYPGFSILTEDEGICLGEDDCPCGRKGKYFKIEGRIKNAEVRGCSDTYEGK
jgi:phenylacetate-coenzyme A ligase PaaK-like adenylate-forming protein